MGQRIRLGFCFLLFLLSFRPLAAVEVVTQAEVQKQYNLDLARELNVYRDPAFLSWDGDRESPLITSLTGSVCVEQVGEAVPFSNFKNVANFYHLPHVEQKRETAKIVPIRICGDSAYKDTLGFVFLDGLEKAEIPLTKSGSLPPSNGKHAPRPHIVSRQTAGG